LCLTYQQLVKAKEQQDKEYIESAKAKSKLKGKEKAKTRGRDDDAEESDDSMAMDVGIGGGEDLGEDFDMDMDDDEEDVGTRAKKGRVTTAKSGTAAKKTTRKAAAPKSMALTKHRDVF
jgi:double-strand break repair protein MRE11